MFHVKLWGKIEKCLNRVGEVIVRKDVSCETVKKIFVDDGKMIISFTWNVFYLGKIKFQINN